MASRCMTWPGRRWRHGPWKALPPSPSTIRSPPSPAAPILDVAAVIEPRIVSAGFRYPRPDQRALSAHVIYVITLYAPHGAHLASWSVDGTAAEALDNPLDAVGIVKRSFEGAMS